jgi:hypothetical protein
VEWDGSGLQPGHTRGHTVLVYKGVVFTGDHLGKQRQTGMLDAGIHVCWYRCVAKRRINSAPTQWSGEVVAAYGQARGGLGARSMEELATSIEYLSDAVGDTLKLVRPAFLPSHPCIHQQQPESQELLRQPHSLWFDRTQRGSVNS